MEINFKSSGEVQIIEMVGVLGEAEAAAVRFKVEEKINSGKQKVVLDLSAYDTSNDAARTSLFGIISYILARQALVISCGLLSENWPLMVLPDGRQIKNFLTLAEALAYVRDAKAIDPKAHLRQTGPTKDEEIKAAALAKLLEKYDVFQHGLDLDPFRLDFFADQYKNAPNREALATEVKVREAIAQVHLENEAINKECDVLAARLKQMITYRKTPMGEKELAIKEKSLNEEINQATELLEATHQSYAEVEGAMAALQNETQEQLRDLETQRSQLKTKLKNAQEQFALEEKNLKVQDAREQSDFEAQIKSKPQT